MFSASTLCQINLINIDLNSDNISIVISNSEDIGTGRSFSLPLFFLFGYEEYAEQGLCNFSGVFR